MCTRNSCGVKGVNVGVSCGVVCFCAVRFACCAFCCLLLFVLRLVFFAVASLCVEVMLGMRFWNERGSFSALLCRLRMSICSKSCASLFAMSIMGVKKKLPGCAVRMTWR